MDELPGGLRRVTLPLPVRPGHVHAYLLPGEDGWTLVDTGLGLPDAGERWADELRGLEGPVARIVITHFHPDHVGAAADVAALTAAPVAQGRLDHEQCVRVWASDDWAQVLVGWFARNGVPPEVTHELIAQGSFYRPFIRYPAEPRLLDEGDHVDGWEVVAAPGHADGQLTLLKDGVLVAADHLLGRITPTVGLWPASRPDPLGDYLGALERTIALAPRLALPGHGDLVDDPVGRARELIAHHRERLDVTAGALGREPRSGYQVSFPLFGADLKPAARRFAVAETLSHLERLVREGRADRHEDVHGVSYTAG
ncbi:Metallo-beta-lactamase-type protein [Gaiella occulta]|uniref:Metallo-beta-lactamase-type protein n=1 Tax=Gaiella occulta TaxID=1002870 RepID=A0A7M2YZN7_9ACTN|nr:MBL fold metallo-hydrolase [Gaiella occulta]RDI75566.1 Metallo-beta-lactamase-type protein [Gaiella occulta]